VNLIFLALISLENKNNVQQQNLLFISGKKHKILRQEWIQGWNAPLLGAFYCFRYSCSFPSIHYTDESKDILSLMSTVKRREIVTLLITKAMLLINGILINNEVN